MLLCLCALAGTARADEVDRFVAQEQTLDGIPAIVVGIYRAGILVDQRATGRASVELDVGANARTAFEIGSIGRAPHDMP